MVILIDVTYNVDVGLNLVGVTGFVLWFLYLFCVWCFVLIVFVVCLIWFIICCGNLTICYKCWFCVGWVAVGCVGLRVWFTTFCLLSFWFI